MIRLESKDYAKAIAPLDHVRINTMFAEAVIKKVTPGIVYVDNIVCPRTFFIAHPYGMSLLLGEPDNEAFKRVLFDYITNKNKLRHHQEWLQVDPVGGWEGVIDEMISSYNNKAHLSEQEKIIRNTRVNFSFNREVYLKQKADYLNQDYEIVRMNKEQFMVKKSVRACMGVSTE